MIKHIQDNWEERNRRQLVKKRENGARKHKLLLEDQAAVPMVPPGECLCAA